MTYIYSFVFCSPFLYLLMNISKVIIILSYSVLVKHTVSITQCLQNEQSSHESYSSTLEIHGVYTSELVTIL